MGTASATQLRQDRKQHGTVTGYFPVLEIDGVPLHESLAICEWAAEVWPEAGLWPEAPLERAQARAASCEIVSGFANLRRSMSCHVFARVPGVVPDPATQAEIDRVFELWQGSLERSGGPYLFGGFGIVDAMYFPVLTRFQTYGVDLPETLEGYAAALQEHPSVRAWRELARRAPRMPHYDQHVRERGGDPDAVLLQ